MDKPVVNPYESPIAEPEEESATPKIVASNSEDTTKLKQYFSLSGSFSRTELLIAFLALLAAFVGLLIIREQLFEHLNGWPFTIAKFLIYIVWGMALGKRSRDLGTTFTYGMIIGCLFPVIGFIFLFQDGKKYKASRAKINHST